MTQTQMEQDIETVRKGMHNAGFSSAAGARPAFDRIVAELERLQALVEALTDSASERDEAREDGE